MRKAKDRALYVALFLPPKTYFGNEFSLSLEQRPGKPLVINYDFVKDTGKKGTKKDAVEVQAGFTSKRKFKVD